MLQSQMLNNGIDYGKHSLEQVGDMVVHNVHLVGPRMMDIIRFFDHMLSGHGTYSLVFRVDKPDGEIDGKPVLGVCNYETLGIAINLEGIFGDSIFKVMEDTSSCINIVHMYWADIMQCVAHEMVHMYHYSNLMPQLTEEEIDVQALKMCVAAAKEICIEPDFANGLCVDLLRDFIQSFQDGTADWAKSQQQLAITGKAYAKDGKSFASLRDVLRHCKYGNPNDACWMKQFQNVKVEAPIVKAPVAAASVPAHTPVAEVMDDEEASMMAMAEEFIPSPEETEVEVAQPTPPPAAGLYPRHDLSNKEITSIMNTVFARIHYHLFTKCGWDASTGPAHNGFKSAANVAEGVYVGDIPNVSKVFLSCEGINSVGIECDSTIHDRIYGGFTQKEALPRYTVYVNKNTGAVVRYTMIPQNKNKCKPAGGPSAWAQKALAGYWISQIYNDKEIDPATKKAKMVCMIETTPEGTTTIGAPFAEGRKVI